MLFITFAYGGIVSESAMVPVNVFKTQYTDTSHALAFNRDANGCIVYYNNGQIVVYFNCAYHPLTVFAI